MRCNNCGAEVINGSQYCQVCGATVAQSQMPYQDGNVQGQDYTGYQGNQGHQQPYNQSYVSNQDASWVWKILSILFPIVGLIFWLIKKDNEPVAAKNCLIWAGAGVALNLFLGLLV